jgi:hypothetical protein
MIKALGAKLYAAWSHHKNEKWIKTPLETQEKVLKELIKQGAQTRFGKDHNFEKIKDLKTYQKEVPVRDYEGFKPYIDAILEGEKDVLWKGRPLYYAKSSGTTSGAKYIPITKASMPQHIRAAREALLKLYPSFGEYLCCKGQAYFCSGQPSTRRLQWGSSGTFIGYCSALCPWLFAKKPNAQLGDQLH